LDLFDLIVFNKLQFYYFSLSYLKRGRGLHIYSLKGVGGVGSPPPLNDRRKKIYRAIILGNGKNTFFQQDLKFQKSILNTLTHLFPPPPPS